MQLGRQRLLCSALLLVALLGGWPAAPLDASAAPAGRAGNAAHARPYPRRALLQAELIATPPLPGGLTGALLNCQAMTVLNIDRLCIMSHNLLAEV